MTTATHKTSEKVMGHKKTNRLRTVGKIAVPVMIFIILILFIVNAEIASQAVMSALRLCAFSLIPSVFPCLVLSGLLVASGGGELFGRLAGRPLGFLFNITPSAACAVILGAVCGFPVGAATAAGLYRRRDISKAEFERIIGFISLPSPAFVINAVGGSMLNNRLAGAILYIILLVSSVIIGIGFGLANRRQNTTSPALILPPEREGLSAAVVSSVASSATSMLKICAYVVFFSTLSSTVTAVLSLPSIPSVIITGILEFSGGCAAATAKGGISAFPLCAAILGWSGFGVHFQVMSVCGQGLSFRKYYKSVLLRGLICFVIALTVNIMFFDI